MTEPETTEPETTEVATAETAALEQAESDAAAEAAAESPAPAPPAAPADDPDDDALTSNEYSVAFSPRQVAVGLAIVAGLVAVVAARRRRSKTPREDG
jgi:hypothetical protein